MFNDWDQISFAGYSRASASRASMRLPWMPARGASLGPRLSLAGLCAADERLPVGATSASAKRGDCLSTTRHHDRASLRGMTRARTAATSEEGGRATARVMGKRGICPLLRAIRFQTA